MEHRSECGGLDDIVDHSADSNISIFNGYIILEQNPRTSSRSSTNFEWKFESSSFLEMDESAMPTAAMLLMGQN